MSVRDRHASLNSLYSKMFFPADVALTLFVVALVILPCATASEPESQRVRESESSESSKSEHQRIRELVVSERQRLQESENPRIREPETQRHFITTPATRPTPPTTRTTSPTPQ